MGIARKEGILVLVTGGAGNMGRRLASALAERGFRVRALCLSGDPAAAALEAGGIEIAFGDVTRKETLAPAMQGVETVFHLAALLLSPAKPEAFSAVNDRGTRNLVEASEAAGVGHFIYVSSISVMYPHTNAYARSKRRGEKWVERSRLRHTIIRPSLAYEDGGAIEFMRFVDHLRRKSAVVLLPGGGAALKSPVHIDDLVAGFLSLPGNPAAFGKTYVFSGGEPVSLRDMAAALLRHMGRPKPVVGVPAWICLPLAIAFGTLARATGRDTGFNYQTYTGLVQDAAPSSREAREDLGFNPRTFRDGLQTLNSLKDCLKAK